MWDEHDFDDFCDDYFDECEECYEVIPVGVAQTAAILRRPSMVRMIARKSGR